jgi:hypothetical protein
MIRSLLILVALLALPATSPAATATAWDTLGGAAINTSERPFIEGPVQQALVFEAQATGEVHAVEILLAGRGAPVLSFALFADGAGGPGAALGSEVTVRPDADPDQLAIERLSGWGGATLTHGQTYWLVARASGGISYWYGGRSEAAGERRFSQDDGASWSGPASFVPLAWIQVSTPPAIPVPASLPLLAGGLAVLCALRRRA